MGLKRRYEIKKQQRYRRRKKRQKIAKESISSTPAK